jgi:FAD synthase
MYPSQQKLCPPRAIYAGRARLDGRVFPAAIAVMTRRQAYSTVLDRDRRIPDPVEELTTVIETHIVGFDGELYGREIWLEFLQLLRPWHDFSSVEDLRSGILADIERSRELAGITGEDA